MNVQINTKVLNAIGTYQDMFLYSLEIGTADYRINNNGIILVYTITN